MDFISEADFIVVGAGPAGCVIAARLAAAASGPSVLLIEAGGRNEDAANLSGPERFELAFKEGTPLNWKFKTQPQWNAQEIDYSRGKGLGGSTAINFCAWVVGADDDFNEWARLVGDDDFAWPSVKKCLGSIENFHNDVPEDFRGRINPRSSDHGTRGPIQLSYQKEWLSTTRDVLDAAEQVGLGVNADVNDGNPIGMGLATVCIYNGTRVTAASAYLSNAPPNLHIITDAQIERIILEGDVATGVQTLDGRRFKAKKEVIISAGTISSPQILMLSGIGPADELKKHGIKIQHHLPQVGENLLDHCFSVAGLVVKKDGPREFKQTPTPMGWFKAPAVYRSQEFQDLPRQTRQFLVKPHVPTWEMATHSPFMEPKLEEHEEAFSAICLIMNPQSRGTITLHSADPKDHPLIDPKFLQHPFDRRLAIEGMREMLRFFEAPVWKRKTVRKLGWPRDDSDEAIWESFSSNLKSSWHMVGTVAMGHGPRDSCVDSSFQVHGLKQLRVADLSVCPLVPNNHTQSTAYVVGEIAAQKLIDDHGLGLARSCRRERL